MRAFGYDFQRLEAGFISELLSLEREGAIYTDHWIDALQDYRHVRIAFTPAEIKEYVRSLWAYDLFLRAGSPRLASEVPDIPPDIAARADAYVLHNKDGPLPDPPHHCVAAFLGPELEALVCCPPDARRVILEESGTEALVMTVKRAVDSLTPAIRCFNRRERGLAPWPVRCEDDVRDLLYAMLRASIADLRTEEAVPSRGGTHKLVDIFSELGRLFVEVKWIGKAGRWKRVLEEVSVDIQSYIAHPACEILVFVIIDAVRDVPDPALIEKQLSGSQMIAGKEIEVFVFVREP